MVYNRHLLQSGYAERAQWWQTINLKHSRVIQTWGRESWKQTFLPVWPPNAHLFHVGIFPSGLKKCLGGGGGRQGCWDEKKWWHQLGPCLSS